MSRRLVRLVVLVLPALLLSGDTPAPRQALRPTLPAAASPPPVALACALAPASATPTNGALEAMDGVADERPVRERVRVANEDDRSPERGDKSCGGARTRRL